MKKLFTPDLIFGNLNSVTPKVLNSLGIKYLVIDLDNTLVAPHTPRPTQNALDWLKMHKDGGITVFLVSNNTQARVDEFCEGTMLLHLHRGAKPLPFGILSAARQMGAEKSQTALLGDQILTDVIGARLAGIRSLMVRPIIIEQSVFFKFKRHIERILLKNYTKNGGMTL